MRKARDILCHITVILSAMFLVFLILDQFNPMMNFVDNDVSHLLLGALCVSGIAQSLLTWRLRFCRAKGQRISERSARVPKR